jgi:hypothetical protein
MNHNEVIKKIFEVADDSLQGVLGYHFYVMAAYKTLDLDKISDHLPNNSIPLTHSWVRYYDKVELIKRMTDIFEVYQSGVTLINMVSYFEVALKDFFKKLNPREKKYRNGNYKDYIKWAYSESKKTDVGDLEALPRLPITFGKIDNARRLRNQIVHSHGCYTELYEKDAINENGIQLDYLPDYEKNGNIYIRTGNIIDFSKSHIEVLHVLHNGIQKRYFDAPTYGYLAEHKKIEWDKIFWRKQ